MSCFSRGIKKSYCAVLLTVFYVLFQAFVMLADVSDVSPNLLDVRSVHIMNTIKNVTHDATVARRAAFAFLFSMSGLALMPRRESEAFLADAENLSGRLPAWDAWLSRIGAALEASPSADMVSRK